MTSKTAKIQNGDNTFAAYREMSTAAKLLSPFFNFCCFAVLCAITPSIGVINYILKIYAFKFAVLLPISAVGQG